MSNFYNNYLKFCNDFMKSPSAVALDVGLSKTAVNGWKHGRSNPTDATLAKLASYFGCSVEDLLQEPAAENEKKPSEIGELNEAEISLVKLFRALPEDRRSMVLPMLEAALRAAGLSQSQE